jgi:hypothetical protein
LIFTTKELYDGDKLLKDYGIEPEQFNEKQLLLDLEDIKILSQYTTTEGIFAPWAFFKSDFEEIGGHDPLFAPQSKEDSDIFNRFQLNGVKFTQTWEGFVYHMTCRGSRFNPELTTPGKNSPEWEAQNIKSSRNFLRKWGHFCKHDQYMKPIIPHKYNIGFKITHCPLQLLELLEPWCDKIFIRDDMDITIPEYIKNEQPNTKFDLKNRIKQYNDICETNILVEFDGFKFTQQSYQIIQNLSQIIAQSNETGEFELDIFRINISSLQTYEKDLIKL